MKLSDSILGQHAYDAYLRHRREGGGGPEVKLLAKRAWWDLEDWERKQLIAVASAVAAVVRTEPRPLELAPPLSSRVEAVVPGAHLNLHLPKHVVVVMSADATEEDLRRIHERLR